MITNTQALPYIGAQGRVAIVAGVRTPFARMGTTLKDKNAIDLGACVADALIARCAIDPETIDQAIFGMTVMQPDAPFIAREIVLASGMSPRTDAYSITRACATSLQTAISGAEAIALGQANTVMVGGTDSISDIRIGLRPALSAALRDLSAARSMSARLRIAAGLRPRDFVPARPSITEYSTGQTMGASAQQMAHDWSISREIQDDLAHASHEKAAAAIRAGHVDAYRIPVAGTHASVNEDNLVRENSQRNAYARLSPVYEPTTGSVTAGNASPLTDGAAGLMLMSETRARSVGLVPLAYIRSAAFAAKTPATDLLMGPVLATPTALARAGVTLAELDLIDMHEAFAAQLEANIRGMESATYLPEMTGDAPLGEIKRDILNVNGGSLAYGHPFGATGARLLVQTAYEMARRDVSLALCTACAAGGIGAAVVLERA